MLGYGLQQPEFLPAADRHPALTALSNLDGRVMGRDLNKKAIPVRF
jgi:hypothetical protein